MTENEGTDLIGELRGILSKVKNPSEILPQEEFDKLSRLANPDIRLKLLANLFFIDKISKSSECSDILLQAARRIKAMIPDMTPAQVLSTIRALSELNATDTAGISNFVKPPGSDKVNVNVDQSTKHLTLIQKPEDPIIERLKNIKPERLEKIARLVEALAEKASKEITIESGIPRPPSQPA